MYLSAKRVARFLWTRERRGSESERKMKKVESERKMKKVLRTARDVAATFSSKLCGPVPLSSYLKTTKEGEQKGRTKGTELKLAIPSTSSSSPLQLPAPSPSCRASAHSQSETPPLHPPTAPSSSCPAASSSRAPRCASDPSRTLPAPPSSSRASWRSHDPPLLAPSAVDRAHEARLSDRQT